MQPSISPAPSVKHRLLFRLRDRAQITQPALRGPKPKLHFRYKMVALTSGAHTNGMDLWSFTNSGRIDRRPTFRAERLGPLIPTLAPLDVNLKLAREQLEGIFARQCDCTKRGARQDLTVCAIADHDLLGIYLRLIGNVPAMTSSIDPHLSLPSAHDAAIVPNFEEFSSASADGDVHVTSALPPKPDMGRWFQNFRFVPIADIRQRKAKNWTTANRKIAEFDRAGQAWQRYRTNSFFVIGL